MRPNSASPFAVANEADDYWSGLTDDDLDQVVWFTAAPRLLANVQAIAPPELGRFIVEVEYKLDTKTDQPVRCSHCPMHMPHWHGFVLLAEDGKRYLMGSSCGPKAYGADYLAASNARREKYKRFEAINRWRRVQKHLSDNIAALAAAEQSAAFRCVSARRGEFETQAPRTLAHLRSLRPSGATDSIILSVVEQVRDMAAERTRDDAFHARAAQLVHLPNRQHREQLTAIRSEMQPGEPITHTEERQLGALQGWRWLLDPVNPVQRVRDILARLTALSILGQTTVDKSTTKLEQSARMVERELPEAAQALAVIGEAGQFFAPENLSRLAAWASSHIGGAFQVAAEGSQLYVRDPLSHSITLTLPLSWRPPKADFLM